MQIIDFKSLRTEHNVSVAEICRTLNVHSTLVYKWDRKGVNDRSPYYNLILEYFTTKSAQSSETISCTMSKSSDSEFIIASQIHKSNYNLIEKCAASALLKSKNSEYLQHLSDVPGPDLVEKPRPNRLPNVIIKRKDI